MLNKKAQMGETMTWVVATLVIVILLSLSIYAATIFAKTRVIDYSDLSFSSNKDLKSFDLVLDKSLFAYFLSSENSKEVILKNLQEMNKEHLFYVDFDLRFEQLKEVIKNE